MTSDNINNDGGYYAIKGFEYQFDKTILELFTTDNHSINIEQIQDIDSDDVVIQVKYKETAKLIPSEVNIPISKLINEFIIDPSKDYILYAYFQDTNGHDAYIGGSGRVTLDQLDIFLGNQKDNFTKVQKTGFVKKFKLDLSSTFAQQFETVISKIRELDFVGDSYNEAIFYYSNISNYLRKLVINNPLKNQGGRTCTKDEVIGYLREGKDLVYRTTLRISQGDEDYFKFIKKQHFSNRNIDYIERFLIVELCGNEGIADIKEVIFKIKDKFYNKSGTWKFERIKSPAPYIFLKGISEENLIQLKKELLDEKIIFKDGFDFSGAPFSLVSIKEDSTIHNNLCLKLVNNEDILNSLISESFAKPKEIYHFFISESTTNQPNIKNVEIQIKNISDIKFIL
jgi:hypothetical protein